MFELFLGAIAVAVGIFFGDGNRWLATWCAVWTMAALLAVFKLFRDASAL